MSTRPQLVPASAEAYDHDAHGDDPPVGQSTGNDGVANSCMPEQNRRRAAIVSHLLLSAAPGTQFSTVSKLPQHFLHQGLVVLLFQVVPAGSLDSEQLAKLTAHLSSSPNVSQHQRNVFKLTGMSPYGENGCRDAWPVLGLGYTQRNRTV